MAGKGTHIQVGKVMVSTGGVFLETPQGLAPLAVNNPVYRDSVIVTKAGGHVEVKFEDGTVLSQGANARMAVDNYVFDSSGASPSGLLLNMGQGAFRVITGKIATQNPENFNVKTPLATIGIRGTDFTIETGPNGDLVLVGKISPDHILLVEDHFGTVRFINYAGMIVVLDEQHGITEIREATPEEIERIQNALPVTSFDYQEPESHGDTEHGGGGGSQGESHGDGQDQGGSHGGPQATHDFDTGLFNPFGDYHGYDVYRGEEGYRGLLDDQGRGTGGGPWYEPAGGETGSTSDVLSSAGADVFDPGAGGQVVQVVTDIFGTTGPDVLTGTSGPDNIYGLASDDLIHGDSGSDRIYGMAGNDTLFGDGGDDTIFGEAGNDSIAGGVGNDVLFGGPGRDVFTFMEMGPGNADAVMDFAKTATGSMPTGAAVGDRIDLVITAFPGLQFNTYTGNFHLLRTANYHATGSMAYSHTYLGAVTSVTYPQASGNFLQYINGGGAGVGNPSTLSVNQHYTLLTRSSAAVGTGSYQQPYLAYFSTSGRLYYDPDGGQLNPGGTIATLSTVGGGHPTGANLNLNIIGSGGGAIMV